MTRSCQHIVLLFIALIKQASIVAQSNEIRNFAFFSQKEGLSNYNIHKIIQDKNKFLWLATQGGLNRFDGKEFVVFNKGIEPKRSLFSTDIRGLVQDSLHGVIWAICNEGGINGIDINTSLVKYPIAYCNPKFTSEWRTCAKAVNHKIYIGCSDGIEVFNTQSHKFEYIDQSVFFPVNDPVKNDIRLIDADEYGNIWLGIKNKGLLIFDPVQNKIIKRIPVATIAKEGNGSIFWPLCGVFKQGCYWLGTKSGIYKIGYDKNYLITTLPLQQPVLQYVHKQEISHLCFTGSGMMICGSKLLAYKPDENKITKLTPASVEDERWVTDITYCFEDEQKNIWLGCKQGLGLMKNSNVAFTSVKNTKMLGNKLGHLYGVCAVEPGKVIVGTKDGLYLIEHADKIKQLIKNQSVQNVFRLTDHEVLISGNQGIQLYSNATIVPAEKKYPEFSPYQKWQFNGRIVLNDSTTIIGTEIDAGILVWNPKNHTTRLVQKSSLQEETGLLSNTVNAVFVNKKKEAVVLSDYGFTVLDPETNRTKKFYFKLGNAPNPLGIFMDMAETPRCYWLNAYGEGLVKLDKNFQLLKIFGLKEGICNTGLYKIFNYKDSLLILTSNNGISTFDVQKEQFKKYFVEDGLQNNTFEEACGDGSEDIFYAGGSEGFVKIVPSAMQPATNPPQLFFTNIKIQVPGNRFMNVSDLSVHLFHVPDNALQTDVSFSAVYFSNPSKVQYVYRIKELDSSWISNGTQNRINFTGIGPGSYTLEIKASNEDGYWSKEKQLVLVFEPKWYQTWLFNLGLILATTSMLYGFYRYRINLLRKQQQIRADISRDLHDDIGSSLNTAKIFTHLARKEQEGGSYLDQIEDSLTQAITGMRDIIWVLDDSLDTAFELMERIKKLSVPILHANGIQLETTVESDGYIPLLKTEKRNLLLIAKEFINNSLKYAACKKIKLCIQHEKGKITLILADDGKGFDLALHTEGNGLKNICERAKQINYLTEITSCSGKGIAIKVIKK